jgi:hypothetical protein
MAAFGVRREKAAVTRRPPSNGKQYQCVIEYGDIKCPVCVAALVAAGVHVCAQPDGNISSKDTRIDKGLTAFIVVDEPELAVQTPQKETAPGQTLSGDR